MTPMIAGTVQFYLDTTPLGAPRPVSYGYATATANHPPEGTHQVRAVFTPSDSDFYATSSDEATLTVTAGSGEPGGGEPADEPPVNIGPPSIFGEAIEGETLLATPGTWENSPTEYLYEWEDCDTAGHNCEPVAGGYLNAYTLSAADVGHTIRVVVTAENESGWSEPVASPPTAVVQAQSGSESGGESPGSGGQGGGNGTPTPAPQPQPQPQPGPEEAHPGTPSASQVKAALMQALKVSGKGAKIGELLKHRGYTLRFSAPSAGSLVLGWYSKPRGGHGKPLLVAALKASFHQAGRTSVKVALTAKGRKLLAGSKRLGLTAKGSFTPAGGAAVSASLAITVKR
jgi:hypothetical protein